MRRNFYSLAIHLSTILCGTDSHTCYVSGRNALFLKLPNSRKLFHRNLVRIAQCHLVIVTMSQVSRIYIIIYDVGIIERKVALLCIDRLLILGTLRSIFVYPLFSHL
ncbi:unnamed protein product [Cylicocyclus nassatus]|uniref:Uncharacterized protein n=1 Tax=Cylicocyclus nassatus TaxID=53992 RepID=A0AA36HBP1_CYLNA|nr:unnamed protein product [Cylicocyclus nassatus]